MTRQQIRNKYPMHAMARESASESAQRQAVEKYRAQIEQAEKRARLHELAGLIIGTVSVCVFFYALFA